MDARIDKVNPTFYRNLYKNITKQPIKYVSNTYLNLVRIATKYLRGMIYFSNLWSQSLMFELVAYVVVSVSRFLIVFGAIF